jgi:hypothetical protein
MERSEVISQLKGNRGALRLTRGLRLRDGIGYWTEGGEFEERVPCFAFAGPAIIRGLRQQLSGMGAGELLGRITSGNAYGTFISWSSRGGQIMTKNFLLKRLCSWWLNWLLVLPTCCSHALRTTYQDTYIHTYIHTGPYYVLLRTAPDVGGRNIPTPEDTCVPYVPLNHKLCVVY